MVVKEFEPRIGVFRQQAVEHYSRAKPLLGGVVPRVLPLLAPMAWAGSIATVIFLGGLAILPVESVATGRGIVPGGLRSFAPGTQVAVRVGEVDVDRIQPAQPARLVFGDPASAAAPEARAIVVAVGKKADVQPGHSPEYQVVLAVTAAPSAPVPDREISLTAKITTRRKRALDALVGWSK